MAFYLGSFANGLFNGAQSAFTAYSAYQGIRQTDKDYEMQEEHLKTDELDRRNQNVPGWRSGMNAPPGMVIPEGDVSGLHQPYAPYLPPGAQKGGTPAPGADGTTPPSTGTDTGPVDPAKVRNVGGPQAPAPGPGITAPQYDDPNRKAPVTPLAADIDRVPRTSSPGTVTAGQPKGTEEHQPSTRENTPTIDQLREAWRTVHGWLPFDLTTGQPREAAPAAPPPAAIPSSAVVKQPYGPPPATLPSRTAAPAPPVPATLEAQAPVPQPPPPISTPAPSLLTRPSSVLTNKPIGSGITLPGQQGPQQAGPPPPPQPTPYSPGMPVDDRGHYYDAGTQQWLPIPTSVLQRPSAITNRPVGATVSAPSQQRSDAAPTPTQGGGIVSSALNMLVPSAAAGTPTAADRAALPPPAQNEAPLGAPGAAAPPPAAAPAAPAAPAGGITPGGAPAAPAGAPSPTPTPAAYAQPPAAPASGITTSGAGGTTGFGTVLDKPATPAAPAKATGDERTPPPVPVKGTDGQVMPNQASPSLQSQPTTPAYAPPVHPMYLNWLQHNHPQDYDVMHELIQKYGNGMVLDDQVAATWRREGGYQWNVRRGADGEYGPLQVMPQTFDTMNRMFGYHLNPNDPKDAMAAGILYMRYLAVDKGLGVGSIATNYAYMAGEGAPARARGNWAAELQNPVYRKKLQSLDEMYDGKVVINPSSMNPGATPGNERTYTQAAVEATTPDGLLSTMAQMGPAGLGMTDRWRHLQAMMEGSAMAHGRFDVVPHVAEYVAQMAHQGMVSNLMSAYTSMQAGDMQGAANAIAKSYAFFPDGAYARVGVDKQGHLGAVRFDEGTGQQLGQGFLITKELLLQKIMEAQHPNTFTQVLDEHRKTNATIAQLEAHAQYYHDQPGIKQALLDQKEDFQRQMQNERFEHDKEKRDLTAGNAEGTAEKNADVAVGTDYREPMKKAREEVAEAQTSAAADPGNKDLQDKLASVQAAYTRLGQESQISRELRIPVQHGGAGLVGPNADVLAQGILGGKYDIRARTVTDSQGNKVKTFGVYNKGEDPEKTQPLHWLSNTRGISIIKLAGAVPLNTTPPPANTQHTSIGAGLNDPRMSGRFNTNLAGITPVSQAA